MPEAKGVIDRLREALRYEPETGKLFWAQRPREAFASQRAWRSWNSRYADSEAFTARRDGGYKVGTFEGKKYRASRVIWAIVHAEWPCGQVDHENGITDDDRISNLRDVTHGENGRNQKLRATNESGVMGVHFDKSRRQWVAFGTINGCRQHIGRFKTKDEAVRARVVWQDANGFHKNHGRN